ncbi:Thioredoxin [Colletotrichum higginsianum IMI 349063]|uniref:Thioredoxin n=3 Tax=Colletotrichum higginsianum TaxID=80884 RepID=A0A1B7XRH0_COLHI|nr:Thioredoxin [Colletotrichum higginsianum IMI 349063]OBR02355.1 Thioredoxin [Colletotrichum higginsianum IMI 349063]
MSTRIFRPFQRIARSSIPSTYRNFHASLPNMVVHNVTSKAEFDAALEKNLVLVDAFATWCGPCKAIAPLLVNLSNEEANSGVHFVKIDVDELPDVSQELGIRAMPTFLLFRKGKKVQEVVGANPAGLKQAITKLVEDDKAANANEEKPQE